MFDSKNKQYFNQIYDSTYISVLRYFDSKCNNKSDIEDLIQDVYFEFYKRINKYGFLDIICAKAFLISICQDRISRYYKKRGAQSASTFDEQINSNAQTSEQETYTSIEDNVLEKMLLEKIWEDISTEGEEISEIFRLKFVKDLTFEQISDKLGQSESTIKSKFYRALQKIKNKNKNREGTK